MRHEVEQGTEDWFSLRFGRATSSNFGTIMANYGKAFGAPARDYALKIVLEGMSGTNVTESFSNGWMEQGTEREPLAIMAYEEANFIEVKSGAFYSHDSLPFGGSPDGIIEIGNGGIEVKCPKFNTHYATIKRGGYDPSYKWQLIGNIWLCDLDFIDFISYCPEFPESSQLFVDRITRESVQSEIDMLKERLDLFVLLIDEIKQSL